MVSISKQEALLRTLAKLGVTLPELFKRAAPGINSLARLECAQRDYDQFKKRNGLYPDYLIAFCKKTLGIKENTSYHNVSNLDARRRNTNVLDLNAQREKKHSPTKKSKK